MASELGQPMATEYARIIPNVTTALNNDMWSHADASFFNVCSCVRERRVNARRFLERRAVRAHVRQKRTNRRPTFQFGDERSPRPKRRGCRVLQQEMTVASLTQRAQDPDCSNPTR